jgi:hypothetical protein
VFAQASPLGIADPPSSRQEPSLYGEEASQSPEIAEGNVTTGVNPVKTS